MHSHFLKSTKPIKLQSVWFVVGLIPLLQHSYDFPQSIPQSTNLIEFNKLKTFSFWFIKFSLNCWLINAGNKYYNSITRQSGIVHKDKAMRQLDLFLLQWLVAGSEGSLVSFAKISLICWFVFDSWIDSLRQNILNSLNPNQLSKWQQMKPV